MIIPTRYEPTGGENSGGSADILHYIDTHLSRTVAIKKIRDQNDKNRIFDEIKSLLTLRSKHVVQIFDIIIGTDNEIGIIMEFIHGRDLDHDTIQNLDPKECLKLLWQIASGISDIHAVDFIHRDIKPENMKLDNENVLKIFDFGLARESGAKAETTGFKGTPGYAAPELFRHGTVSFTKAVDTYAFGVACLIIAGGQMSKELLHFPPLPAANSIFSSTKIVEHPELTAILFKCLDHVPENRPAMPLVRDTISKHVLKGQHQALIVMNGKHYYINTQNPRATLTGNSLGRFSIIYDGINFTLNNITGEVFINAREATDGLILPGSSVVAIGAESRGAQRSYATFDISNPEVTL